MAHNCSPQLSCQVHYGCLLLSFCCMLALLYKETCAGKNNRFFRHSPVVPSLYEAAWDLVTNCLRNPHTRSFSICFPAFSLMFPHVWCSVFPVSLGIFYISPSVSLCFLFWALRNLDTFSWNRSNHGETLKEEPLHSRHFYSRRCYGRHSFLVPREKFKPNLFSIAGTPHFLWKIKINCYFFSKCFYLTHFSILHLVSYLISLNLSFLSQVVTLQSRELRVSQ